MNSQHESSLRITSWNILAPLWVHPSYFPEIPGDLLEIDNRRKVIENSLCKLAQNSDVLCLQECQGTELNRDNGIISGLLKDFHVPLLSANEETCWKNWIKDTPMQPNGTIILFRKNKFNNVKIFRQVISSDGNAATIFTAHFNGHPLIIVNSHLDTDSLDRRSNQANFVQTLFSQFEKDLHWNTNGVHSNGHENGAELSPNFKRELLFEGERIPLERTDPTVSSPLLIWSGDFNSGPDHPIVIKIGEDWVNTLQDSPYRTLCHPKKPRSLIDYVFIKKSCAIHCKDFKVNVPVPEADESNPSLSCTWALKNFGSDHLPVTCCFQF